MRRHPQDVHPEDSWLPPDTDTFVTDDGRFEQRRVAEPFHREEESLGANRGYDYHQEDGPWRPYDQEQRRSFRGVGPRDYQRSDARIHEDVNACLTQDHAVDASAVHVVVEGGVVTLTGTVPDRMMKHRVEELLERISGVREIENQLKLARPRRGI
jgi:hypothetical protein